MTLTVDTPQSGLVRLHDVPFTGYIATGFLDRPDPVRFTATRKWLYQEGFFDLFPERKAQALRDAGLTIQDMEETIVILSLL